jgi:hypothetical protein
VILSARVLQDGAVLFEKLGIAAFQVEESLLGGLLDGVKAECAG